MLSQQPDAETWKANVESVFSLANTVVEGEGKLAELNSRAVRSGLTDALDLMRKSLSVNEPGEWTALQESLQAPTAERVQQYCSELFDIVAFIQTGFMRFGQAQYQACNQRMQSMVEAVAKDAPGGSEAAIAAWNSAVSATNALYDTLQKSGEQTVEVAKSNLDLAVGSASKGARGAIKPPSQDARR